MPHRLILRRSNRKAKHLRRERKKKASSEDHKWSKIQPKERRGENSNVEEGKEESDSVNNTAVDNTATNTGTTASTTRTPLLDAYLANVRATLDSGEMLRKLQRESDLMLVKLYRVMGTTPPSKPSTDARYAPCPAVIALEQFVQAVKKGSYKIADSEGNGEDAGEELYEDEEDGTDEQNIVDEEESEDEEEDSSSDESSSSDGNNAPSSDNAAPQPIPSVFASLWTDDFAQQYAQMCQDSMENLPEDIIIDDDALVEYYLAYQNTLDNMPEEIVITEEDMREHHRSMFGPGFM